MSRRALRQSALDASGSVGVRRRCGGCRIGDDSSVFEAVRAGLPSLAAADRDECAVERVGVTVGDEPEPKLVVDEHHRVWVATTIVATGSRQSCATGASTSSSAPARPGRWRRVRQPVAHTGRRGGRSGRLSARGGGYRCCLRARTESNGRLGDATASRPSSMMTSAPSESWSSEAASGLVLGPADRRQAAHRAAREPAKRTRDRLATGSERRPNRAPRGSDPPSRRRSRLRERPRSGGARAPPPR